MSRNEAKSLRKKELHRGLSRLVFFALFIFFMSAVSVVTINGYLFPYLATVKWLSAYPIFRAVTENVVVVNKTEQVTMSEDQTISRYVNRSASSVVGVVSRKSETKSPARSAETNKVKFGSGLIATADGLILTYRDAIFEEQAAYKVFISVEKAYDARLVAVDSYTNLAFLKIDTAEDLPTASFVAPEDIKVGTKVVGIGRSDDGFQAVYRIGLLSQFSAGFSLAGPVASSEKLRGVYLSDFNMEGDGSERMVGGAVADYNGNIVGMLGTKKAADRTSYFIIAVNHLQELADRYLREGAINRGSLGAYFLSLSKETAALHGAGSEKGAMIFSPSLQQGLAVIAGSAAEKAGLKIADVIMAVNGEEVDANRNLAYLISKYKPGEEVVLKILREGKEMEVRVVLQ